MPSRSSIRFAPLLQTAPALLLGVLLAAAPPPPRCAPAPTSRLVVNVKAAPYRAAGNGVKNDTIPIQLAIQAVAGTGGTVLVPAGEYLIDATAQKGRMGLVLGSRMTLRLEAGAVLKALPNEAESYSILAIEGVTDVHVVGGTLVGDRTGHLGSTGEWGMGIQIARSSRITVEAVTARDCWGDGFYVANRSTDVTLCGVTGDRNRRQGVSIVGGEHILVRDSTFKNTAGTEPECGIDIEPNPGETVSDLTVTGCLVQGNRGGGIAAGPAFVHRQRAFFTNSRILRNQVTGNRNFGIGISACDGNTIEANAIQDTEGYGILLRSQARNIKVTGNTITRSRREGIHLEDCPGSLVTGNTITGNYGPGIVNERSSGATVQGNRESGNGR